MVEDRYANHRVSYIIAMITMLSAVLLFGYTLFVAPFLFLHLEYDIPSFHFEMIEFIQYRYSVTHKVAHFLLIGAKLFIALLLVIISTILSRRIERDSFPVLREGQVISFSERYPGFVLSCKLTGIIIIFLIVGIFFKVI